MTQLSSWHVNHTREYPPLETNLSTDVVIIGGGIAGILSAYLLAKAGYRVVVLESERIGSGATQYTTAFITQDIDTSIQELITMFGPSRAEQIWHSGRTAIDEIENIVREEKIDCEFMRCSLYTYAQDKEEFEELEEEVRAAKKIGFETSLHREGSLGFEHNGYREVKDQAKFHPLKFLYALAERAELLGVRIFEKSEVREFVQNRGVLAGTSDASVQAAYGIVATYSPFNNPWTTSFKKGMYMSYVLDIKFPKGIVREGLYLDLQNPYHYFRVDSQGDHDRLIIGGEDHRAELPMDEEKNFAALEEHAANIFPGIEYSIVNRWKGQILEPSDGLPLIGEYAPRQFIASAFSGNGMTYAMISALMFRDAITGKRNPWTRLYNPKRIPSIYQLFKKGGDYIGEFFGGALRNTFRSKKAGGGKKIDR